LIGAAKLTSEIVAVVSRGGRPDLAREYLPKVVAPTLLLVGSLDTGVIEINRIAMDQMTNEKKLVIISGATHLFEEQGALEEVAKVSTDWFLKYLR
jgi:putative phosphoribosyl transferase